MNKELHIVLVEDSEPDAALVVRELLRAGYDPAVKRVDTESDFLAALDAQPLDLILCDYSMPHFDGLTALRLFKDHNLDIPFIFVSGAISEDTAVGAMKSGAHDYVMKSNLRRLAPAVERELREARERLEKRRLHEETYRIQQEMKKKDELFRALIEHSSDGISLLDASGNVLYESPSMQRILGYEPGIGHAMDFFGYIHPDDREQARTSFDRLVKRPGETATNELRVRHCNSTWRWIETASHNLLGDEKVGAIVVNYRDINERKHAEELLRRSQEQLRALAANLQIAREEERKNIAREFHDQLGQSLTAIRMSLSLLHRKISHASAEFSRADIASEIRSLQSEIDRATQSIRHTMAELRPEMLDQLGILATLTWEAERFSRRSGILCTFETNVEDLRLDPVRSIALFRIFQEAITNVSRHSHATRVEVSVEVSETEFVMSIRDNGIGIDSDAEVRMDAYGLTGMRERAHLLNAVFEIAGGRNAGTTITVRMPMTSLASVETHGFS